MPTFLVRNLSALFTAQVLTKFINLAVSIAVVRVLGARELGLYAYILAFAYPFGALAEFGLSTFATKEVSREKSHESTIIPLLQQTLLWLAGMGWLAMVGLAFLLGHDSFTLLCLSLAGLSGVLSSMTAPQLVALSAQENFQRVSLYQVIASLLGSAAILSALSMGGATLELLLASTIVSAAMIPCAFFLSGKRPVFKSASFSQVSSFLTSAFPFGLLMVGFALYYRIDLIMLKWLRSTSEVGTYAAAYRFLDAMIPLAAVFGKTFYPRLSLLAGRDPAGVKTLLELTWKPILGCSVPLALGVCFVADPLVVSVFGEEFQPASTILQILIWGSVPLFLISVPLHALMASNFVLRIAGIYGISLGVNVLINITLIPLWGGTGAALATILCEWLILILVVRMVKEHFAFSCSYAGIWRIVLATILMACVLWMVQGLGLTVGIVAGAFSYLGVLTIVGYFGTGDLVDLKQLWNTQKKLSPEADLG